jgi:hypothetical protein
MTTNLDQMVSGIALARELLVSLHHDFAYFLY